MTFFEKELLRIFEKDMGISDICVIGNTCYGRLSQDIRVKANFVVGGTANQYGALKVTMLNRNEGPIDSVLLHFSDLWGRKKVNNPNFRDGIYAHIWKNGVKPEWYVYQPTESDYRQLSRAVSNYLDVFREPVQEQQMGQKMC